MSQNIMNTVYIAHCMNADPDQHWYVWLEQQLKLLNVTVERIFLADASHPDPEIWQTCLEAQLKKMDEQSIVVAHGLSCVAVARYLTKKLQQKTIKAGIFIAGFNESIPNYPALDSFINHCKIDAGILQLNIQRRVVIFSSNNPIVPVPFSFKFSHLLNAQLIEVAQAGHFRAEDGYSEFPQLLPIIQALLKVELS
ncbi:alpha/beta hydrolase [Acinetobacter haemolyticus]|uniref:RBBP9/YdeN family alpha/beta hydrolase n=1 Tax=Acinetobacter haemolyticus TaxID=29430 RepID=UPI002A6B56B7|nr:alpha/beta hydrolase [Acinetobacter haemolyticus]WPO66685.1 alpha/beta hydrolase [Acinetobacter haemolyticus]